MRLRLQSDCESDCNGIAKQAQGDNIVIAIAIAIAKRL
jgi:hypothetical protein